MEIRILAKTRQEKGKLFEHLMEVVLDAKGYHKFRRRTVHTGMEIDIVAYHKVTSEKLLCECKAHNQPIGPKNLNEFFGKVLRKRSKNTNIKGIFASLSGSSSNALEGYEEDYSPEDKLVYALLDNSQIQDLLRSSGLLISDNEIISKIKSNTELSPGDRYLVYFESRLFIIQILEIGGKSSHYLILTGKGELVHKTIERQISKLDKRIKSLVRIDLQILDRVTISLLDLMKKSIAEISREINETENDVSIAIEELKISGLLHTESRGGENVFAMKKDMESLTKLVRKYAFNARKYDFMTSAYIENMVNDEFATYVKNRFKLQLDQDKTNMIISLCRIFASVLSYVLLTDNSPFIRSYQQSEEQRKLQEPDQERRHTDDIMEHEFFDEIVTRIRTSLEARDDIRIAHEKGVRGFHMVSTFKIASETDLLFSSYTKGTAYMAIASGTIRPGSAVKPTNISTHISIANTYLSLQLYDEATKTYEVVKKLAGERQDILRAAWYNQGLCYTAQNNFEDGKRCYEAALKIDPDWIEALSNLEVCYRELGENDKAKEVKQKLEGLLSRRMQ